jgi:hypothetical protein
MKRFTSKVLLGVILSLSVVLWGNFSDAAVETTAEKIVAHKDSYDGKEVSVSGTISNLKFKTLKGGNKYATFLLVGGSGGRINVIISEHPRLKPGQKVRVTGYYRKAKKTAHRNYYNEIEASEVSAF